MFPLAFFEAPPSENITTWYAAPNAETGNGTFEQPFSLTQALNSPSILPGHTLLLRGGTYTHTLLSMEMNIIGTPMKPIIISNVPGETVRFQDFGFRKCLNVRFISEDYGIIFQSTLDNRVDKINADYPYNYNAFLVGNSDGARCDFINIRFDNIPATVINFFNRTSGLIYGCVNVGNGWIGPDRAHGPWYYGANGANTQWRTLENNIVINSARYATQIGDGGGGNFNHNVTVKDMVTVGASIGVFSVPTDGLLVERLYAFGGYPALGLYIDENFQMEMRDSRIDANGSSLPQAFIIHNFSNVSVHDNEFSHDNYTLDAVPGGNYDIQVITPPTSGVDYRLVVNEYAPRFASLAVIDWSKTGSEPENVLEIDCGIWISSGTIRIHNPAMWDTNHSGHEYRDVVVQNGRFEVDLCGWTNPLPTGIPDAMSGWFVQDVSNARRGVFVLELLP